ncbi:IS1595 family transposase [Rhodoferax mekongensis]|uniref:IS1595 family transposase n=1 Tax=Rhodoferax mekongensis TaxID=3068341 RepID=A0ABZ0AWG8_9BURK|nr:IS1595 family transposase [Rhodoferax sp. TBRC 17307]WNO03989.1 IS1595 family transposase [Rhodoferax sp. TBRC 17307]
MRASQFKALLAMLPGLSPEQLADLRSETERIHHHSRARCSIDEAMAGAGCPHCNSFKCVKNGTGRGVQRYRCMDCSKTFNAATNTPLAHLHSKKQFFQHGECLQKGLTIRATAKELGVSVSTAFRWRHRFLAAVVGHQPRGVTGIFEADETYFRESQKGSRKLISPEDPTKTRPPRRHGGKPPTKGKKGKASSRKDLVPVLVGRLRGQPYVSDQTLGAMTIAQATDALRGVVGPGTLVCIDGSAALRGAAKSLGAAYHSVAVTYGPRVEEGVYHVQNVNSYHEGLKTTLNRVRRGVSTKYMPNYLAWTRLDEWYKGDLKPEYFVISGLGRQLINC